MPRLALSDRCAFEGRPGRRPFEILMVNIIASVEHQNDERILKVLVLVGLFRNAVSDLLGSLAGVVIAAVNQRTLQTGTPERFGCQSLIANLDPQVCGLGSVRWFEVGSKAETMTQLEGHDLVEDGASMLSEKDSRFAGRSPLAAAATEERGLAIAQEPY